MEENPDRENIVKVRNMSELLLIEKAIKPKITDSYQRKTHPDVVHDFTRFTTESIKGIMKDIVNMTKKKKEKG